ncbi:hypothetical protein GJ496_008084 [Pomphorhynchus laevis]|nr:hypothetical protein GJ496_008084 [Pomphorhynchus laevis]
MQLIILVLIHFALRLRSSECPVNHSERSCLWLIKRQPPCFILGTIHAPFDQVMSANVFDNRNNSLMDGLDRLYLELDTTNAFIRDQLRNCQYLPANGSIADLLTRTDLLKLTLQITKIQSYINKNSMYKKNSSNESSSTDRRLEFLNNWIQKRPIWLLAELNNFLGYWITQSKMHVMDHTIAMIAHNKHIPVESLETVEEQCQIMNDIDDSMVIQPLLRLSNEMANKLINSDFKVLALQHILRSIQNYRCGMVNFSKNQLNHNRSTQRLNGNNGLSDLDNLNLADIFNQSAAERDSRLSYRILDKLNTRKNEMALFAVGLNHLEGLKSSIITTLKQNGYELVEIPLNTSYLRDKFKMQRKRSDHADKYEFRYFESDISTPLISRRRQLRKQQIKLQLMRKMSNRSQNNYYVINYDSWQNKSLTSESKAMDKRRSFSMLIAVTISTVPVFA